MNNFFILDSKFVSSTFQAYPVGLDKNHEGLADEWRLIKGDYEGIHFPVTFKQDSGKKLLDIIDTGWVSLYLISDAMKGLLEQENFSGWKTYLVKIVDKQGKEINRYHGLSITGRCGAIDYAQAQVIERRLVPNGPLSKRYKGLPIGLDKWDGSDFFLPENTYHIIVTKKVADTVRKNKLTNVSLENIEDIETPLFAVK